MDPIFLDYNSTTPVDPKILQNIKYLNSDQYGNPASINHSFGRESKKIIDKSRTQIASGLFQIEKAVMDDIEMSNDRVAVFEALKHLIVGGNVLLFVAKEVLRVLPLSHYVIQRDPMGNVLEIITKESIHYSALPENINEAIQRANKPQSE